MMNDTSFSDLGLRSRQFALASLIAAYPDDELGEILVDLKADLGGHEGAGPMIAALGETSLEDLQGTYIDLFDRGKERVSLYETEHGRMRGLSKGNDLADIAGFYLAFGLKLESEKTHEMLDHVAVELEFYSALLRKHEALLAIGDERGGGIVEDARRKFLTDHLGRFVRVIADQAPVQGDGVYGPAFAWCASLIEDECARLGAIPVPLDFFADDGDREDTSCGAVRLPMLQDA
jgi:nitrate reductase assembly molybdenum cofactor insertion protein NarJ